MKTCRNGHSYLEDFKECPTCQKIYRKKYYELHKKEEKEKKREWESQNRERVAKQKNTWNKSNPGQVDQWYKTRINKRPYDSIWRGMIARCYRPKHHKFKDYGARGITVCERWRGFPDGYLNFEKDMGERPSLQHSIDRIDNNGNYEPNNVKWSSKKEQQRNRRGNRLLTIDGRTQSLAAWVEEPALASRR